MPPDVAPRRPSPPNVPYTVRVAENEPYHIGVETEGKQVVLTGDDFIRFAANRGKG